MDQPIPPAGGTQPRPASTAGRPDDSATVVAGQDIAAECIARMRELVGSRPMTPEHRAHLVGATQELRQVLFHLCAYNDIAAQAYLPRISAVGVRRELTRIEQAIVAGRRA